MDLLIKFKLWRHRRSLGEADLLGVNLCRGREGVAEAGAGIKRGITLESFATSKSSPTPPPHTHLNSSDPYLTLTKCWPLRMFSCAQAWVATNQHNWTFTYGSDLSCPTGCMPLMEKKGGLAPKRWVSARSILKFNRGFQGCSDRWPGKRGSPR